MYDGKNIINMTIKKKIGFIGLGSMGSKLAERLMTCGFQLGVFNRTPGKMDQFVKNGAWKAKNPKELAQKSDIIVTCVTNDAAIRAVMEGENGALAGANAKTVFIDMSTVSVSITKNIAKKAQLIGANWLDAPVLGSPQMAEAGEMPFVVGGPQTVLEENRDILEAIGKKIVYMGESGMGQASKIVHSLVCAVSLVAYSEALLLGEKFGLTRDQTLDVLLNGAVASPLLKMKAPKFKENMFKPTTARLFNMCKDLSLIANEGIIFHQALPTFTITKELYDKAKQQGLENEDTSSIIKIIS